MRARAVALLALTLMAMLAVGDVIWPDIDVIGRNDFFDYRHHRPTDYIYRDDSRIDEVFPIKHRCSEVRVLIHAQRRTMGRMIESCKALKWADDRFHALMQTNPGDALAKSNVYGTVTTLMEMFVLDRGDPEFVNYLMEFWNSDRSGFYIEGVAVVSEREEDTEMPRWRYLRGHHLSIEVHEYVHHLQFDFGWLGAPLPIWDEGGATFIQFEYVRSVLRNDWYATAWDFSVDGWEVVEERVVPRGLRNGLPQLTTFFDEHGDKWEDLLNEFTLSEVIYFWGAWIVRFILERHRAELPDLKEMYEDETGTRMHDLMAHLNDDWHAWHEDLATLSVATGPEPITIIKRDQMIVDLGHFFRTINALAFDVSLVGWWPDDPTNTPLYVSVVKKLLLLHATTPGTWEFTVRATNVDGESAELPFTVTVVERLEANEIVIGDPLSTEEGRTVVDLNQYFDGPEDIAFAAESANAEVATAAVTTDGRLVVTAISPGEAEITVRATSGPQSVERTFIIAVTDECPPWLCRGSFSGWRKALLQ